MKHIDLKKILSIILKRIWLVVAFFLVFTIAAGLISSFLIPKIYQAQTTMFIGKEKGTLGNIGLSLMELETYNQLIIDYKEIANSRLVIMPTINNLKLNMNIEEFRKALSINIIEKSRLFTVSFSDKDPIVAANVANELAKQLSIAVAEIVNVENIRILDKALIPTKHIYPIVSLITIIAGFLGILIGLFIIYLMEILNNTFSRQEDIEDELNLNVLAVIPKTKKEEKDVKNKKLITLSDPDSYISESYRLLRTNINYIEKNNDSKVFMLTSSTPSEGKTTTSCNLAITMAQANKRVLLIDGDLRKPLVYKNFKINMSPGLTNVLCDRLSLSEVIQSVDDVPGLDILVAGKSTSISTEILGCALFEKILDEATNIYDFIIIDSPPILHIPDTVIISKLSDKILFVVAMEKINREVVKAAKRALDKVGIKMMGLVLTKMSINAKSYSYYHNDKRKVQIK